MKPTQIVLSYNSLIDSADDAEDNELVYSPAKPTVSELKLLEQEIMALKMEMSLLQYQLNEKRRFTPPTLIVAPDYRRRPYSWKPYNVYNRKWCK